MRDLVAVLNTQSCLMKSSGSYSDKERLDHAVGFPVLRVAAVAVNGCLDDSHHVVTKIPLKSKQQGRIETIITKTVADVQWCFHFTSKSIAIQTTGHQFPNWEVKS